MLADLRSSGELWALAFAAGAAAVLDEGAEAETADWRWRHFALSDQRSRLFIERHADLPPGARRALLGEESRVHAGVEAGWTFGALPDLERAFDGRATGLGRLFFALNDHTLITARRHPLQLVDALRREAEAGAVTLAAPADAIIALAARFIDATETRLADLSNQLDHAEDQVLSDRENLESLRLGPIRRELSLYHREFLALRSAFHRAGSHRNAGKSHPLIERLPPLVLEIEDFDRDLAGLQDRARLLHDEIDAKLASAANRSLQALTVMSTLLLPPTLIVGAFGMNVQGVPFAADKAGFWEGAALCLVTVAASYWALRAARVLR